jgi:acyl-CoA dehydrogenase
MRSDAIDLIERGEKTALGRAALAKVLASEAAWEAGRAALTAFGGWGLAVEYDIERKLRDAAVFVFNNMLLSYISEKVLGLPKAF